MQSTSTSEPIRCTPAEISAADVVHQPPSPNARKHQRHLDLSTAQDSNIVWTAVLSLVFL